MIVIQRGLTKSSNLLQSIKHRFSKLNLNPITLNSNKFQKQFDGFLIYNNLKTKTFQKFGLALSALVAYSGVVYFVLCDETSRPVYLPLIILSAGALILYELKMRMTTKFITLDRRGQLLMLVYYKWLGYSVKSLQVPVTSMMGLRNYSKWLKLPSYGYKFQGKTRIRLIDSEGVQQHDAFSEIMNGKPIKIIGKIKTQNQK